MAMITLLAKQDLEDSLVGLHQGGLAFERPSLVLGLL
jgi:hypothetical protein